MIGADQIARQAPTLLVEVARTLPQFKNTGGATNGGSNTVGAGQSALNLRGLGVNRNLVLLDGRRVVPSSPNGVVNIDVLPSGLVSRLDVVTGGASAAYGSDAVSGVVNFVLDTKFDGLRGSIQSGISGQGDNASRQAVLSAGTPFAEGRGHIVVSGEYFRSDGVGPFGRAYQRRRSGRIANVDYTPTNGQPQNFITNGIVSPSMTTGGLINGGVNANGTANNALRGIAFGPGGVPYQFRYGTNFRPTSTTMIAPPGADLTGGEYTAIGDGVYIAIPNERKSLFSHAYYDVSDALTVFVEGMYADVNTGPFNTAAPYRFGTSAATAIQIRADNPFLPTSIAARMSGPGGGSPAGPATIYLGRNSTDWGGFEEVHLRNRTARALAGARGNIGDGWKWNAYYQYGQNRYNQFLPRNLVLANLALASDAVRAPAGNAAGLAAGTIACRSTLTNPGNGCVPINVFGFGAASPEAIDYVLEPQRSALLYRQHVLEGQVQGNLFATGAGNVAIVIGGSYRREDVNQTSDPLSQARAFVLGNPQPFSGRYSVKEAFGELSVPLLRDVTFAQELSLDVAARYTDYSLSGGVTTWKGGVVYAPVDGMRFRATRSRDIRAPSLNELFLGAQQFTGNAVDPTTNTTVRFQSITSGSTNLVPERADTLTAGVVLQPDFLRGVTLSVDYYRISIEDIITQIDDQQILDRCFRGNQDLCALISRTGGVVSEIRRPFLNLARLKTSGLDFEGSYRVNLQDVSEGLGGELGLRILASYVIDNASSDGVTTLRTAGSVGDGEPHWTGRGDLSYEKDGFGVGVIARYVGPGVYSNLFRVPNAVNFNDVDAKWYFNLNMHQRIGSPERNADLYAVVDNLFDVEPPIGFNQSGGYAPAPLYDTVGRSFRVGIRFRY